MRSYIEDKFPEGPANGVFPRDPDLRDFVVWLLVGPTGVASGANPHTQDIVVIQAAPAPTVDAP